MKVIFSLVIAALTPSLIITGWYLFGQFMVFDWDDPFIWVRTSKIALSSMFVSSCFVVILGIPAFVILRRAKAIKCWSTIGTGFLLGAIPAAIFLWPLDLSGNSSSSFNGVEMIVSGVPTIAGWLQYIYGFSFVGFLGLIGSLSFWLIWRR